MRPEDFILWAVALAVGFPAAWRNPTALALLGALIVTKAIYLATGNGLAVDYYIFPDVAVLAVIFAKREFCNLRPYRSTLHQLKCVLLERSPADRVVMLIYPLEWTIYCSSMHDYYVWWLLWGLSIIQFLAAGWEGFPKLRSTRAVSETPHSSDDVFRRLAWGGGGG